MIAAASVPRPFVVYGERGGLRGRSASRPARPRSTRSSPAIDGSCSALDVPFALHAPFRLRSAPRIAAITIMVVAMLVPISPAFAQDFAAPEPRWPPGAAALLEHGLPSTSATLRLEALAIRWFGLAELTTRAAAVEIGWRSMRLGCGVSQTGAPDVGWTTAGLAAGVAHPHAGAALRAVAHRDRTTAFGFSAAPGGAGVQIGGGAWAAAAGGVRLWAAAPQVWTAGEAPPLRRPLELGVVLGTGWVAGWISHSAVTSLPAGGRSEHAAGVAATSGRFRLWIEARDRPLRGGFGIAARIAGAGVGALVEDHPVLGETMRLGLVLGGDGEP
jgi:hypothetical protein